MSRGETFVERFSRYESLQNEFLHWLRDTGPKTENEIITHFTSHYEASKIKSMLKLTEYAELADVRRMISIP